MQAGANAALGYQKDGAGWKPFMRLGNDRGGGAIASTIGDLLVWNEALTTGKLGSFVTEKIQEPARLANGRRLRYARGLIVDSTPGGVLVSHSGGAAGFSTWMGRVPEHGLSVAVAKIALAHVSGTTFSAAGRPITLTVTLGPDGRATALVMRQNGDERTLPRVK